MELERLTCIHLHPWGAGACFCFRFRSVRLGLGFGYCLAGRLADALIIPAEEDIENRNNLNRKTCSIRCEGIVFYVLRSEKRPAVSLPWGDCVGMGIVN